MNFIFMICIMTPVIFTIFENVPVLLSISFFVSLCTLQCTVCFLYSKNVIFVLFILCTVIKSTIFFPDSLLTRVDLDRQIEVRERAKHELVLQKTVALKSTADLVQQWVIEEQKKTVFDVV